MPCAGCKAAIETLKVFNKFTRRVKRESMSVIYDFCSFHLECDSKVPLKLLPLRLLLLSQH